NFHFPIIGITGSNGKTIVKEWLNFLLSPDYNIARSPKSYNSQIGVPLSVLGINENHNFGIFESGISLPNEMQNLEQIISPTIGILTNIDDDHDEGFTDKEQKISEKLKLFKHANVVIFQKNELVEQLLESYNVKSFCWSFEKSDNALFIKKSTSKNVTTLEFTFNNQDF